MILMSDVLSILDYESKSSQHCFQIVTPKKTYVFKADSEELAQKWIDNLSDEHDLFMEEQAGDMSWTLRRALKQVAAS
jgi:hypothetical protein